MMDLMRQESIMFQCSNEDFDYTQYMENGMQTNGCGSYSAIIYMVSFYMMVPLIFLNLFVAVILEGFEQTSKNENLAIQKNHLERFIACW